VIDSFQPEAKLYGTLILKPHQLVVFYWSYWYCCYSNILRSL